MNQSREKSSFRLPKDLLHKLHETAISRGLSRTAIVEAALASHLSPDAAERLEAALARRLDHHTRHLDRLAWQSDLTNETLALFIRFWLTSNPPLPDAAAKAALAMGKERWERFLESLGRRMSRSRRLRDEIGDDIGANDVSN